MVEMVSRRLQQRLLLPPHAPPPPPPPPPPPTSSTSTFTSPYVSAPGGSGQLCGAMREAILSLCRDKQLAYGGQVEVDGIICITGPQDGQQLVVKVHELLRDDDSSSDNRLNKLDFSRRGHREDDDDSSPPGAGCGGGGGDNRAGSSGNGNDKKNGKPPPPPADNRPPETNNNNPDDHREEATYPGEEGDANSSSRSSPAAQTTTRTTCNTSISLSEKITAPEVTNSDPQVMMHPSGKSPLEYEHRYRDKEGSAAVVVERKERSMDIERAYGERNGEDDPKDEDNDDDEDNNGEDAVLNMSDRSGGSKADVDSSTGRRSGEMEALDLRLDSPAARAIIKQEPMEYEESMAGHHHPRGGGFHHHPHHFHPYGSSGSSSGSIYRPGSSQDTLGHSDGGSNNNNSFMFDDRFSSPAAAVGEGGSNRRARSSSPHTPHTPLLVPFMGPAHPHHPSELTGTADTAAPFSPAPPGASPFMDSRLRHLLAKMPYGKPHPGLPFLHRRPLFPTMSMLHSGAPECKACGFTFAQVELLKEHNEAVHAVFTCNVCYRTFTSRSNLDRHSRLHTGHKPYICVKCGKAFSRKDHLTNHSAKHAFKCGKCLKRFVERDALQGHYDQDHQVMLTNICEHCNKGFSDPAVYAEHLKSHPEYLGGAKIHPKHKPFACTECNYVCADKLQLLKHSQLHAESGQNLMYNCLACGESFTDPLLYSQHFEGHQEETDVFECCICRKMCHTWRELKQHEQTHLHLSSRGPTLACPVCYIIFDNPDVLAEHVQSHDPSADLDGFPCNVCNEVFPTLEEQQRHEQEEKHYVKKAFISPHNPLASSPPRSMPASDGQISSRPASVDRTHYSSACDSDSNDSEEELDVIAIDEPSPFARQLSESSSTKAQKNSISSPIDEEPEKRRGDDPDGRFVVTDNPAPVIEVSPSEAETRGVSSSSPPLPPSIAPETRSHSSSSSSPFAASMSTSVTTSLPLAPPSAAVFPERSPIHPSMAVSPPPLHIPPGPLASILASHSPQPSPDPLVSAAAAAAWLPPQFHHHNHLNNAGGAPPYGFPTHLSEYACPMCDAKLLSFHDYETHCFSDHFRYPCMYCTKTFAQKANRDRHVCIHTGEKPYTCPECDQKFARGDKLKIHRTKWHNVQFPTTYNRPKEGAGSGDWPSSRRNNNKESSEDVTLTGSQKEANSGRWSDPESQDQGLRDNQDPSSSYRSIKPENRVLTGNHSPE